MLGEHQLLYNYSEFRCHGYCAILGANYMIYAVNTNLTENYDLIGSTTIVVVAQVPYTRGMVRFHFWMFIDLTFSSTIG